MMELDAISLVSHRTLQFDAHIAAIQDYLPPSHPGVAIIDAYRSLPYATR